MHNDDTTRTLVLGQLCKYPKMQVRDLFKYLYQSSFGCEHLLSDESAACGYITREYENGEKNAPVSTDKLDGAYSRVHLSYICAGMSPKTLARIFCLSAKRESDGEEKLDRKLGVLRKMARAGELPFGENELEAQIELWKNAGFGALHHSDEFRAAYRPAYRVVSDEYAELLPLFVGIDKAIAKKGAALVAIEGGSASGKTTLSRILEKVYDCNVVHADDFFLRGEQRTPERFAEIGGNLDRERLLAEVLGPLSKRGEATYRPFDCATMTLGEPIKLEKKKLTIVEGAYSMHPELEGYYDFSVFLDVPPDFQRRRILKRNTPEFAKRFFDEWIPLEVRYFEETEAKTRCALSILIEDKENRYEI